MYMCVNVRMVVLNNRVILHMYFNKHLIVLNKCLGMVMIVNIMFHGSLLLGGRTDVYALDAV